MKIKLGIRAPTPYSGIVQGIRGENKRKSKSTGITNSQSNGSSTRTAIVKVAVKVKGDMVASARLELTRRNRSRKRHVPSAMARAPTLAWPGLVGAGQARGPASDLVSSLA